MLLMSSTMVEAQTVARVRAVVRPGTTSVVSPIPTSLAELEIAGRREPVEIGVAVDGGDAVVTTLANTHLEMASNGRHAYLFEDTFVEFNSVNTWFLESGAFLIVNPIGRLELIKRGYGTVYANSTLLVEVAADGGLNVYVFEGQVVLQNVAGAAIQISPRQAGQVNAAGNLTRAPLTPNRLAAVRSQADVASNVMDVPIPDPEPPRPGGGGGVSAVAIAAVIGGAAAGGFLLWDQGVFGNQDEGPCRPTSS